MTSTTTSQAIAGALFDFAGFLTTLPAERAVALSACHEAGPIVELLSEWAEKRGLLLDEACVNDWPSALVTPAQAVQAREAPTDDEIDELWRQHAPIVGGMLSFARAVLAKWGAQPAVPEGHALVPVQQVGTVCPACGALSEVAGCVCVDCYYSEQKTGELSTDYVQGFAHGQATLAPPQPAAQAAPVDADVRLERERICAAIKAEDDYCVEHGDYMLDSDDCIKIVRGEWQRPDFAIAARAAQKGNYA